MRIDHWPNGLDMTSETGHVVATMAVGRRGQQNLWNVFGRRAWPALGDLTDGLDGLDRRGSIPLIGGVDPAQRGSIVGHGVLRVEVTCDVVLCAERFACAT